MPINELWLQVQYSPRSKKQAILLPGWHSLNISFCSLRLKICSSVSPPPRLIFMPYLIYKHTGDIFPLKGLSSLPSLQCLGTNPIHWLAVSTPLPEFMVEKQILSFFIYLFTYLDLNAFYMSFLPVSHFLFFPCLFKKKIIQYFPFISLLITHYFTLIVSPKLLQHASLMIQGPENSLDSSAPNSFHVPLLPCILILNVFWS